MSVPTTDFVATLFDGKANPEKVTVTLTLALNAVKKGHTATLVLMAAATGLGLPDAAAGIDIGAPFKPAAELLEAYLESGGRVAVCSSCLVHNGFTAEQVDSRYLIINGGDVIDLLMAAKGSLQVT